MIEFMLTIKPHLESYWNCLKSYVNDFRADEDPECAIREFLVNNKHVSPCYSMVCIWTGHSLNLFRLK